MQEIKCSYVIQSGGRNEDRIEILRAGDQTILVVADGAGGISGGAQAAEVVCARIRSHVGEQRTDWKEVLRETDSFLVKESFGGESTGVVAEVRAGMIRGASVGDSGAWLITSEGTTNLTERQMRKPLIGSGNANPKGFGPVPLRGRLLLATDGLLKYVAWNDIADIGSQGTLDDAVQALVTAARLPSGALQDDIAVVLCSDELARGCDGIVPYDSVLK